MPYDCLSENIPFELGELQTSKRGQKIQPITVNGKSPLYQLTSFEETLYAPFGCGVYQEKGDETRLDLDLQLPEGSQLLDLLDGYDQYFREKLKGTTKSAYHPMVSRDREGTTHQNFKYK